jgi:hypothetical protein
MVTLRANAITLEEVEQLRGFTPLYDGQFSDFLTFSPTFVGEKSPKVKPARFRSTQF